MIVDEDYPRSKVTERPRTKKEAKDFNNIKPPWDDIPIKILIVIMLGLIYVAFR